MNWDIVFGMSLPPTIQNAQLGIWEGNNYYLKRKILKLVGGTFHIFDPSGAEILRAEKKGFKLKEDIRIFGGPGLQQELVGIFARQVMDFSASYDVIDSLTGNRLAVFQRKGWKSILRDEWVVLDAQEREMGQMVEDNMGLALLRRFLSNLIPQNYDLIGLDGNRAVDLKQNFNPFSYHLNVDFYSSPAQFDRRIGLAGAVLLAAIEGRQSG